MENLSNVKSVVSILSLFIIFSAADTFGQRTRPVLKRKVAAKTTIVSAPELYSVAMGTVVRVRMNNSISSKTSQIGNTFTVTVTEPVYSSTGVVVIPTGSTLKGRVDAVKPAAKAGKPGEIDVSFIQAKLPNGLTRTINGSLTELGKGDTRSDSEGTASGAKMKNRKLIFIGGGGAGGTVLGAAIGGGKGALIGGIVGAGAGFLGEKLTKGKEAKVESGTEFGVYLNRAIAMPKFVETTP